MIVIQNGNFDPKKGEELRNCGHFCVDGYFIVDSSGGKQKCNIPERNDSTICPFSKSDSNEPPFFIPKRNKK
jgi:hypothetical protein